MNRSWWARFVLLFFLFFMGLAYLYPSFTGMDREADYPIEKRLSLGLDLQGGLHMTLGIDFKKAFQDQLQALGQRIIAQVKDEGVTQVEFAGFRDGTHELDPVMRIDVAPGKNEVLIKYLKENYSFTNRVVENESDHVSIGLKSVYRDQIYKEAVDRSIQVIRNRIDEFGVTEPVITSQGQDRIVVQLPGVADVDRAKNLIGQTAKLEFRIVSTEMSAGEVDQIIKAAEKEHNIQFKDGGQWSDYVSAINEKIREKLPKGTSVAFSREVALGTGDTTRTPYLLSQEVKVSGEDLQDAYVTYSQFGRPEVAFNLKPSGAKRMGELTGSNLQRQMAIVLDNIVHSAPVIQGKISDAGVIQLGQGDQDKILKEARDTAIVLRAGALPVQLEFQEQRVVGPSLGKDSIDSATKACIVGAMLVLLFILLYYRMSGIFAVICLGFNISFLLALLVSFDATLTLPGIAGIALTIGMAVDGNIIVFERIREEVNKGKGALQSIEAGFSKAFSTIIDANITTALGGFFLLQFGTGPIRGFAVTLLVGILTTVYTSYYVSKVFFEIYMRRLESKQNATVSI